MVTEAGKELLRNTINTAKFHNKILEENEMWKQWEIERGLTMMVSDDDILKRIRKNHQCAKHRQMEETKEWCRSTVSTDSVAGTSSADRWDHSGFQELYPDEPIDERRSVSSSSSSKEHSKKWNHSGFEELYPGESFKKRPTVSSSSKEYSKKWDHSGYKELYPDEYIKNRPSIKTSFDKSSKKHKKKKKKRHQSESSTSDSEIYEEFKEFKRKRKSEKEKLMQYNARSKGFDSHVKEWKKHKDKYA